MGTQQIGADGSLGKYKGKVTMGYILSSGESGTKGWYLQAFYFEEIRYFSDKGGSLKILDKKETFLP